MPVDPEECRLYALHCAEMAANARTPQLKLALLKMSANWQRAARDLEATQDLLTAQTPEGAAWLGAVHPKVEARPH